jgi:DNA-binding transcriptional MerR regulator
LTTTTHTQSQPTLVRISELARLSNVPAPTIKHYIREGLLPGPARRTGRNMAYYDPRLAERIRAIKELQQKQFLPLDLIGEILEPSPSAKVSWNRSSELRRRLGELGPAIRAGAGQSPLIRRAPSRGTTLTRVKVEEEFGITGRELDDLARLGVAEPQMSDDGVPMYSGPDLEVLEIIEEVRSAGMGDLFPMSVILPYIEQVRALVRMELEQFRARALNDNVSLSRGSLADIARESAQFGARLIVALRTKLLFWELDNLDSE